MKNKILFALWVTISLYSIAQADTWTGIVQDGKLKSGVQAYDIDQSTDQGKKLAAQHGKMVEVKGVFKKDPFDPNKIVGITVETFKATN